MGSPAHTLLDDNRAVERRKFRGEKPRDLAGRDLKRKENREVVD